MYVFKLVTLVSEKKKIKKKYGSRKFTDLQSP